MEKKLLYGWHKNSNANVTKSTISNDSATLTQNSTTLSGVRNKFQLSTKDGMFYRFMFSENVYEIDSEVYHRVLLQ